MWSVSEKAIFAMGSFQKSPRPALWSTQCYALLPMAVQYSPPHRDLKVSSFEVELREPNQQSSWCLLTQASSKRNIDQITSV